MSSQSPTPDTTELHRDICHVLLGGGTPTGNIRLAAPSLDIKTKADIICRLFDQHQAQSNLDSRIDTAEYLYAAATTKADPKIYQYLKHLKALKTKQQSDRSDG